MAHLPLKFVQRSIDRHGKPRHNFRRKGFKTVALHGLPGSAQFMAEYQAALAESPRIEIGAVRSKPGSVAAAVATYLGSIAFGDLADATKRDRMRILERFREDHGEKPLRDLMPVHVANLIAEKKARPHSAKSFLKALRGMIAVAIMAGLCESDPTAALRVKVRAHASRTWTEEEIAQFEAAHPIGSRGRLAFALLLFTGQRRGDVIRMGRQHIRDGFMTVRQGKTGACLQIPVHPDLQVILARSGADHLTFLTTAKGKPFTGGHFTNWFGGLCRAAGLPLGLSAHGLRRAMCRRLAEAGCSANQIAAISGHATLKEVSRYTKAADQKRMAIAAMEIVQRTSGTQPPLPKVSNLPQVIEKKEA